MGPVGLGSPPSPVLCDATTALLPVSGASLVARLPDTLRAPSVRGLPGGLVARGKRPHLARAFAHPLPHSGSVVQETGGSPTFPSSPSDDMPRSQTPGVSSTLAKAPPGLRPAGACTPSAFLSVPP